jgi:hypothetical protein
MGKPPNSRISRSKSSGQVRRQSAMSFLTPWFLAGVLAVAGPIVFHLIRRSARERMPFSSLMFLRPTPPRVVRRRKIEHFWLLLLRCLCIALLATAFARPFYSKSNVMPAAASEGSQRVLLVDTSASMRREGLWNEARGIAERYLEKASPDDQIALMTFDRQPRTLVGFAEWLSWPVDQRAALARQRLAAVSPAWMGTRLGLALTSAAEQFVIDSEKAKTPGRRELILITDLQEGSQLDGLQGHEWPSGVSVSLERVEAKRRTNAGLQILNNSGAGTGDEGRVHVRVTNVRDSGREKFILAWSAENGTGLAGEPMEIYLPPGHSRTFTAPPIPQGTRTGQLRLSGDEVDFDNLSYFAALEVEHVTVAYFGEESGNDPAKLRYYLERVFPETPRRQVQLISRTANSVFSPEILNQAAFAVIPVRLGLEDTRTVHDWLARGKTALLILTDVQMNPTLAGLADLLEIPMTEAGGDYALLGEIDFRHPIFAPFAEPRFSDFSPIHFWRHRRWEIPANIQAHVLAKFDDGSPALVQLPVGKGNLLVLASGWNPGDSQLAISSKFPPLMQTMLDWNGAGRSKRFQFLTGESIPPPAWSGSGVEWEKPDGKKETLAADAPFTDTDVPGIFVARYGDQKRAFAVNLPLEESLTTPLSQDELARLGVPLQATPEISASHAQERRRHLQQSELENRQKLWRWLIMGVLAVTLVELILNGWLARPVKTVEASGAFMKGP